MANERLREAERAVVKAMEGDHQTGEERFNMALLALYDLVQWALWIEPSHAVLLELLKAREEKETHGTDEA